MGRRAATLGRCLAILSSSRLRVMLVPETLSAPLKSRITRPAARDRRCRQAGSAVRTGSTTWVVIGGLAAMVALGASLGAYYKWRGNRNGIRPFGVAGHGNQGQAGEDDGQQGENSDYFQYLNCLERIFLGQFGF